MWPSGQPHLQDGRLHQATCPFAWGGWARCPGHFPAGWVPPPSQSPQGPWRAEWPPARPAPPTASLAAAHFGHLRLAPWALGCRRIPGLGLRLASAGSAARLRLRPARFRIPSGQGQVVFDFHPDWHGPPPRPWRSPRKCGAVLWPRPALRCPGQSECSVHGGVPLPSRTGVPTLAVAVAVTMTRRVGCTRRALSVR